MARAVTSVLSWPLRLTSTATRSIVQKDLRLFVRDITQWGQFLIVMALVVVYIFQTRNVAVRTHDPLWANVLGCANMAVCGFILATLAIRFAFPTISLEGRAFWSIKASPVSMRRFFAVKYCTSLTWVMTLGLGLMCLSIHLLELSNLFAVVSLVVITLFALGFTSLSVGIGACFPNFRARNSAEIASGMGALLTIVLSLSYLGGTIAILGRPLYSIVKEGGDLADLMRMDFAMVGLLLVVLNAVVITVPAVAGVWTLNQRRRRLRSEEVPDLL